MMHHHVLTNGRGRGGKRMGARTGGVGRGSRLRLIQPRAPPLAAAQATSDLEHANWYVKHTAVDIDDSTTTGALELAMVAPLQRAANAGLTDDAASLVSRTRRAMLKRKKVRCCDYLHARFSCARIVASNRHTMLLVHRMRRTRRHSLQQTTTKQMTLTMTWALAT